jgi:hypothetical protein
MTFAPFSSIPSRERWFRDILQDGDRPNCPHRPYAGDGCSTKLPSSYSYLPKNKNNKASSITFSGNRPSLPRFSRVERSITKRSWLRTPRLSTSATRKHSEHCLALHAKAQWARTVQQQAALLGFLDCFWVPASACLIGAPLVFFTRKTSRLLLAPHTSARTSGRKGGCRSIWAGNFRSLQAVLDRPRFTGAPVEVRTWAVSDVALISPPADWLMNLIAESGLSTERSNMSNSPFWEALP